MKPGVILLILFSLFMHAMLQKKSGVENRCTSENCKIPNCRCPGHNIPGGYKPKEIPQMVLITFDDAVNWENWDNYMTLFPPDRSRLNPNGCPVTSTLFVSHNFTDYCMVKKLHARGLEIADHSVTHRLPHAWWSEATTEELSGEIIVQRQNLADFADIPLEDIRGWRSPFLQPTGDTMFNILHDSNFTYDATMTYPFPRNVYSPVMWPFTLDHSYTLVCNIEPCPKKTYPGFWIIPVVVMMDYREHLPCAYVDHCKNAPRNQDEAFQLLWKNFLRNYRTNRAPMYVNLHSRWLKTKHNMDAMDDFILRLAEMDDVFLVTVNQAIEWMKRPTKLANIKDFEPWNCVKEPNLEHNAFCSFTFKPITTQPPSTTTTDRPHNVKTEPIPGHRGRGKKGDRNNVNRDNNKRLDNMRQGERDNSGHQHGYNQNHRPWFLRNSGVEFWSPVNLIITLVLLAFSIW